MTFLTKKQRERLTGLLLTGLIAMNYPFAALFEKIKLWFGIPALYLYLYVVWALFILLTAAIIENRNSSRPRTRRTDQKNTD